MKNMKNLSKAGGKVDYTVTVKNLTGSDKTIAFSDDLAGGKLTLSGKVTVAIGGKTEEKDSLSFDLVLQGGETAIITYTATVNGNVEPGTLGNTVVAKKRR